MGDARANSQTAIVLRSSSELQEATKKLEIIYRDLPAYVCQFLQLLKTPALQTSFVRVSLDDHVDNLLLLQSARNAARSLNMMSNEIDLLAAKYYGLFSMLRRLVEVEDNGPSWINKVNAMFVMADLLGIGTSLDKKIEMFNVADYRRYKPMKVKFEKDIEFQEIMTDTLIRLLGAVRSSSPHHLVQSKRTAIIVAYQIFTGAMPESVQKIFLLGKFILDSFNDKKPHPDLKELLLEFHGLHRDVIGNLSRQVANKSASPKQVVHFAMAQILTAQISLAVPQNTKGAKKSPEGQHQEELKQISKARMEYLAPITKLLSNTKIVDPTHDPLLFCNIIELVGESYGLIRNLITRLSKINELRKKSTTLDDIDLVIQIEKEILQQCLDQLLQFINLNNLALLVEKFFPIIEKDNYYLESKKEMDSEEIKKMLAIEKGKRREEAKKNADFLLGLEEKERQYFERIELAKKKREAEKRQQASLAAEAKKKQTGPKSGKKAKKQEKTPEAPNQYDILFAEAMTFIPRHQYTEAVKKYEDVILLAEKENKALMRLLGLEGKLLVYAKFYQQKVRALHQMLSAELSITSSEESSDLVAIKELFASCNELLKHLSSINDVYRNFVEEQYKGLDEEAKQCIEIGIDTFNALKQAAQTKSEECYAMFDTLDKRLIAEFHQFLHRVGVDAIHKQQHKAPASPQEIVNAGLEHYKGIPKKRAHTGKNPTKSVFTIRRENLHAMRNSVEQFSSHSTYLFARGARNLTPMNWLKAIRANLNGRAINRSISSTLAKYALKRPNDLSKELGYVREQLKKDDGREYIKRLINFGLLQKIFGINILANLDIEVAINIAIYKLQNIPTHTRFFTENPLTLAREKPSKQNKDAANWRSIHALDLAIR
jgi:hypothetical protein